MVMGVLERSVLISTLKQAVATHAVVVLALMQCDLYGHLQLSQ